MNSSSVREGLSAIISQEAVRSFVSLTFNPEPREVQGLEDVLGIDVPRCRIGHGSMPSNLWRRHLFEAALAEAEEGGSRARQDISASE
jgi:hypothetical protein